MVFHNFPLLLLLLVFLLPMAFPLELKVQIVGWSQLEAYSHLLQLPPGKRFRVSLFWHSKNDVLPVGERQTGPYDIATFELPEEYVMKMQQSLTGEFVSNNDFSVNISTSSDGKWLTSFAFPLTSPKENLLQVTLNEPGRPEMVNHTLLPMEMPIRNLYFMIPNNPDLLLKSVECHSGGWTISDFEKGPKILVARNQRVCEGDVYLVNVWRRLIVPSGMLKADLKYPKLVQYVVCDEAFREGEQINGYNIELDHKGQLQCRLEQQPLDENVTKLILRSHQTNILGLLLEELRATNAAQVNKEESSHLFTTGGQSSAIQQRGKMVVEESAAAAGQQQLPEAKMQTNVHFQQPFPQQQPFATPNYPLTSSGPSILSHNQSILSFNRNSGGQHWPLPGSHNLNVNVVGHSSFVTQTRPQQWQIRQQKQQQQQRSAAAGPRSLPVFGGSSATMKAHFGSEQQRQQNSQQPPATVVSAAAGSQSHHEAAAATAVGDGSNSEINNNLKRKAAVFHGQEQQQQPHEHQNEKKMRPVTGAAETIHHSGSDDEGSFEHIRKMIDFSNDEHKSLF